MSGAAPLTVGVIGGLGPDATLDFFRRLLDRSRAATDQERLRVLIDCNPHVPDRNRAVAGTGPSPGPALAAMAAGLQASGADLLVMPCNTAHAWRDDITAAVDVPLLDLIETTADAVLVAAPGAEAVGVLGSSGCLDAGLYQASLSRRGVDVVTPGPEDISAFMGHLYRIKAGDRSAAVRAGVVAICQRLVDRGAGALVAGCTEIPLVAGPDDFAVPLIESTDELVAATVACARGVRPLPTGPPT